MAGLETISTQNVGPRYRMDFWNRAVSSSLSEVVADPVDRSSFSGQLMRIDVGAARLVEVHGDASVVTRRPVRSHHPHVILQQALDGEIIFRAHGVQRTVQPGDLWLYDPSSPCTLVLRQPTAAFAIRVPREQVLRHISVPEAVLSRVISGASGAGALASRYLGDLWLRIKSGECQEVAPRFVDIALQMVAGAYAGEPDSRPTLLGVTARHQMRIQAYIEEHLLDPLLTPQSLSEGLGLTTGYVHRLFRGGSETVSRYILRRRLEECHRILSDPMSNGRSVTAIALDCGFSSLAYFSRSFHRHFGVAPRVFRQQAQRRHCT